MGAGGVTRRRLLELAAAGVPVVAGLGRHPAAGWAQSASPIVKPLPPEWFVPFGTNAEMRWDSVAGLPYTTPNERFFVRNHTATPIIDPLSLRLDVFGTGLRRPRGSASPCATSAGCPHAASPPFIECAGNGRSFFASQQGTPASGTQWKLGAIGVARWRGVPLGDVLERAGVTRRAVDVMPDGLDAPVGEQGHVRRPLPIAKAFDDVLLAYEMNGEPLPPDHGAPLRVVVPGWIGIASIKWVGRIEVADHAAVLALEHHPVPADRPDLPRRPAAAHPPGGQERLRTAARRELRAGRHHLLTGRSWSGSGADPARRDQHRRRPPLAARRPPRPEPAQRLGALALPVQTPRDRHHRTAGARDRPAPPDTAHNRAIQRRRLPLLGRREASSPHSRLSPTRVSAGLTTQGGRRQPSPATSTRLRGVPLATRKVCQTCPTAPPSSLEPAAASGWHSPNCSPTKAMA